MTHIVMLCRDRYRLLSQSLNTLYQHTVQSHFTLTLVNDGSVDFRAKSFLQSYGSKANSTLLDVTNSNHVLAQLKNLGVAWAEQCFGFTQEDWLYISDSDVYFTPGWLEKLLLVAEVWEEQGFELFGGQIHPFHLPIHAPSVGCNDPLMLEDPLTEHAVLDGPSWLLRPHTFKANGKFLRHTAPGVCQSEEYPFCQHLRANNGRIGVINPHVVIHTGLTNSAGEDAPGRAEREAQRVAGVYYE